MSKRFEVNLFFNLSYYSDISSNKAEKNIETSIKNKIGQILVSFQKRFYGYKSLLNPDDDPTIQSQKFYYSVVSTGDNKFLFYKVYNKDFLKEDKYTDTIQKIFKQISSEIKGFNTSIKLDVIGLTKTKVNVEGINKQSNRLLCVSYKIQTRTKLDNNELLIDNYYVYPLDLDNFHFKSRYH